MEVSKRCIERLKELESFSAEPYNDQAGNATIGYGHLMHRGPFTKDEADIRISVKKAETDLIDEVSVYAHELSRFIKVPVNQNQFDALVLWTYNCGLGAMQKSSWLKALNKGDYLGVPALMKLYDKIRNKEGNLIVSNGLMYRREEEAKLFVEPVEQKPTLIRFVNKGARNAFSSKPALDRKDKNPVGKLSFACTGIYKHG